MPDDTPDIQDESSLPQQPEADAEALRITLGDHFGAIADLARNAAEVIPVGIESAVGEGATLASITAAITADGRVRRCEGIEQAEGLAANDSTVLVADVGARRLVAIDPESAATTVVVDNAPIGRPDGGYVPFSFCSVAAHPHGGFVIGCNGDGSIRWLRRDTSRG